MRLGHPARVRVGDVGGVVDVDVGVVAVVEQEFVAARPFRVGLDVDAVVLGLRFAGRVDGRGDSRRPPTVARRTPSDRGRAQQPEAGADERCRPGPGRRRSPAPTSLTGISGTRTKPVPKVPTRAPAVAQAESRPTMVPLARRSCSCMCDHRRRDGAEDGGGRDRGRARVIPRAASSPSPRAPGPSQRITGTVSSVSRPPPTSSADHQQAGVGPIRQVPAGRGPGRDPGEGGADDRGGRLQGQADVRRQQPDREDLEHQHGAGGEEDESRRRRAWAGRWAGARPPLPRRSPHFPTGSLPAWPG